MRAFKTLKSNCSLQQIEREKVFWFVCLFFDMMHFYSHTGQEARCFLTLSPSFKGIWSKCKCVFVCSTRVHRLSISAHVSVPLCVCVSVHSVPGCDGNGRCSAHFRGRRGECQHLRAVGCTRRYLCAHSPIASKF